MKPQNKLHSLYWVVNGVIKETILLNKPYSLCKWKANQLKNTTHKTGNLIIN